MNKFAAKTNLEPYLHGRSFADAWEQYQEEGYIILEGVMPADEVQRVRDSLDPYLNRTGRNDFEGFNTNRVYSLLAKQPEIFSDMVTHPLSLAFAERELGKSCLLSTFVAINLKPGESVQSWHCDDDAIIVARPHQPYGVGTFWAIDDTTELNGATEIIPGSHKWGDDQRIPLTALPTREEAEKLGPDYDPQPRPDAIKAVMSSGSLMIAKSTLYHRGGSNKSDKSRLIVTPQYCVGWARPLESMLLTVPLDQAKELPKRTRELIGYSLHSAFMGYVDGSHPDRVLGIKG